MLNHFNFNLIIWMCMKLLKNLLSIFKSGMFKHLSNFGPLNERNTREIDPKFIKKKYMLQ